jgi:hypothetical protein
VLTDNGIQFADLPKNRSGPTANTADIRSVAYVGNTESNIG